MPKKALPKARPKARPRARPRALPKVSMKYGYLPPDLQRAGQHMERVAFLRNLQKSLADQNYVRTHGGDSGLSEHGAVGLGEKIEMVASKIANPKKAPIGTWTTCFRSASEAPRGRSRSPRDGRVLGGSEGRRVSAAAGSSSQPMRYDLDSFSLL